MTAPAPDGGPVVSAIADHRGEWEPGERDGDVAVGCACGWRAPNPGPLWGPQLNALYAHLKDVAWAGTEAVYSSIMAANRGHG